jgi:hypothetical protein
MRARDGVAKGGKPPRDVGPQKQHRGGKYIVRGTEMDGKGRDGGRVGRGLGNVPFEFVGEVASAGAVAEAGDVERGTTAARHLVIVSTVFVMWCYGTCR